MMILVFYDNFSLDFVVYRYYCTKDRFIPKKLIIKYLLLINVAYPTALLINIKHRTYLVRFSCPGIIFQNL